MAAARKRGYNDITAQEKGKCVCVNVCVSYRKNDSMNESGKKKEHKGYSKRTRETLID